MEKFERLEKEAFDDISRKNYNKAASALYFSLHQLASKILRILSERIPRRDDKLANAIENKGLLKAATALRILYILRKKADYTEEDVSEREILEVLRVYEDGKRELLNYLKKVER